MYSLIRKTAIFLFIAVFLGSCNFFGLLNGGSDGGNVEDVDIQSLTVKSYSNDFKTAMVKQTVTAVNSSEIETIVTAAESGLGNNINSTDLEQYIPIYLEEAQTGINSTSYTDDKKIALLKAISAASMIALKDKDEYLARRSIDPYAESMQKILERVSSSLVKGLSRTGVSSTRLSEAAGESIGSMVEYISDSGVRHETISPSVQRITQSAIKSMVNSGATEASAKAEAVRRITRGATKGATKVCEKIQAPEDLGTMAENISYGASSALKDVSADDTEKKSLMKEVSDGFSEGVNDSLNEGSAIDNDNLKDMVSKAAKGSARAVKDLVDETSDPTGEKKLEFLGEVSRNSTAGASKISIDKVAGAVKEELLGEAVKGTSEGAQEVDDDGVTTAELNTVIIVVEEDELGTQTELDSADYQDEIDEGVLLGQNNDPVANAGSDMEAEIGTQVRLDGSNSYDNDQSFDTLLYEWKTTQSPSLSSSEIVDSDKVIALFTPDAPGEYFISLTVTDNAGVTDTNSFKVVATKPPEDTEFNGLTAEERLEVALNHSLFGRHGKSKDELLIILTRYPEIDDITPMTMIELSWQYIQLRKFDKAMDIALQVEHNYADTKYEAQAMLARSYWYIWHFPDDMSDPERGKSIAEEVITAFAGNDEITLEAEQVVGFYHQVKEEYTLAREVFDPIRTNSSASLRTRFWAAYHYAETYRWAGEFQMAVSEFKNIRDDAAYYTEDDGTINKALMHKVANTVAHIYRWDLREYANAVTAYQWIENNSTVKAFKMYAHTDRGWMHLWDEGDHTAALARASDVRSNYSYASGDDLSVKNAIGWSWQLTGRVYLREYWDHRDVTDLNAAQSAFDKVLADYDEFP